jgi:hypothetical protein
MTPDDWAALVRDFHEESARHPDLRHVLIKLPDFATEATRWDRLNPAIVACGPFASDPVVSQWVSSATWPDPGHEQVFYGVPGRIGAPGWRRLAELARVGVELARESGVRFTTPPPDPAWVDADWAGAWMNLVYRLARGRRPGSLLRVHESSSWNGQPLPGGAVVSRLPLEVFEASAHAAELLSRGPLFATKLPPSTVGAAGAAGREPSHPGIPIPRDDFLREASSGLRNTRAIWETLTREMIGGQEPHRVAAYFVTHFGLDFDTEAIRLTKGEQAYLLDYKRMLDGAKSPEERANIIAEIRADRSSWWSPEFLKALEALLPSPEASADQRSTGAARQSAIVLDGQDDDVRVRGKTKPRLTPGQYRVVKALIEAFPDRLALDALAQRSGTSDPVGMIDRLRRDKDWAEVLDKPGKAHGGYGIRATAPRKTTPRKA